MLNSLSDNDLDASPAALPHPVVSSPPEYIDLRQGVFVSDLHLFSSRSDGDRCLETLERYQQECQCIVLGGDVFDLRWSRLDGLTPTIGAAVDWIEMLLERTGRSRILYLAGNHDCHPDFAAAMSSLASRYERLGWFEHALQIGDALFVHGDILHAGIHMDGLSSYRQKHHDKDAPHPLLHQFYDLAVGLRLHKAVARLSNSPKATCQRLQTLVKQLDTCVEAPVQRVFFGHTHVSIEGLELDNQAFFNPGALLKHTRHQPIEFELPPMH